MQPKQPLERSGCFHPPHLAAEIRSGSCVSSRYSTNIHFTTIKNLDTSDFNIRKSFTGAFTLEM